MEDGQVREGDVGEGAYGLVAVGTCGGGADGGQGFIDAVMSSESSWWPVDDKMELSSSLWTPEDAVIFNSGDSALIICGPVDKAHL